MKSTEEMKTLVRNLFATQNLAVLATHNSGQPYASLIAFAGKDDLKEILFATPRTTRKYTNLRADPRVAVLINSSENEPSDFHRAVSITATGIAEDVQNHDRDLFLQCFLVRHPHLKDFIEAPSTAWVRVKVNCYYMVKNFQKVMELRVNP